MKSPYAPMYPRVYESQKNRIEANFSWDSLFHHFSCQIWKGIGHSTLDHWAMPAGSMPG